MATQETLDLKAMLEKVLTSQSQITMLSKSVMELKEANVKQTTLIADFQTHTEEAKNHLYKLSTCSSDLDQNLSHGKSVVLDAIDGIEEGLKSYAEATQQSHIVFMKAQEKSRREVEKERSNTQEPTIARSQSCKNLRRRTPGR